MGITCSNQAKQSVENTVKENKVVIYSKSTCPFCNRAKSLMSSLGQNPHVVELDSAQNGKDIQKALQKITGQKTVPNIFINGKHFGGCDELEDAVEKGTAESLFQK